MFADFPSGQVWMIHLLQCVSQWAQQSALPEAYFNKECRDYLPSQAEQRRKPKAKEERQ